MSALQKQLYISMTTPKKQTAQPLGARGWQRREESNEMSKEHLDGFLVKSYIHTISSRGRDTR